MTRLLENDQIRVLPSTHFLSVKRLVIFFTFQNSQPCKDGCRAFAFIFGQNVTSKGAFFSPINSYSVFILAILTCLLTHCRCKNVNPLFPTYSRHTINKVKSKYQTRTKTVITLDQRSQRDGWAKKAGKKREGEGRGFPPSRASPDRSEDGFFISRTFDPG